MPVLDSGPYLVAEDIVIKTRAILNDMQDGTVTGDLFADDQPYTFVLMDSSYSACQDILMDMGVATYTKEAVIPAVPASSMIDYASQCQITFSGFTQDGITTATPALPTDLLQPLIIGERPAGTNGRYLQMRPQADGKPFYAGYSYHRTWDWRQDALYLPVASQAVDLAIRYLTYAPAISGPTSPIMIMRVQDGLSYLTASRFAETRGSALAAAFEAKAMASLERMANRDDMRKQRQTYRRRPYGSGRYGRSVFMGSGGTSPLVA